MTADSHIKRMDEAIAMMNSQNERMEAAAVALQSGLVNDSKTLRLLAKDCPAHVATILTAMADRYEAAGRFEIQ